MTFPKNDYFRLKGLSCGIGSDPTPKKRSNSLPIPKIEVTLCDPTDTKTAKEPTSNIDELATGIQNQR